MSETMHLWETDHNGEIIEYPIRPDLPTNFGLRHVGPRCKLCGTKPCIGCEGSDKMMEDCPAWLKLFDI